jgi:hypothetical protein
MTVASRILASFRIGHKIIGGVFRLAVYGKILQGEAELLEQHDRERCVGLGSFYRLADSIAKESGMPIEEVDKLISQLASVANPDDPDSMKGSLQAFGLLNSDPQQLISFLSSQAQLADQKKVLATTVLLGRGDYLDAESNDWVRLQPGDWSAEDTAQLPADLIDELQAFLLTEKDAMLKGGKDSSVEASSPPGKEPAAQRKRTLKSSAETSSASG